MYSKETVLAALLLIPFSSMAAEEALDDYDHILDVQYRFNDYGDMDGSGYLFSGRLEMANNYFVVVELLDDKLEESLTETHVFWPDQELPILINSEKNRRQAVFGLGGEWRVGQAAVFSGEFLAVKGKLSLRTSARDSGGVGRCYGTVRCNNLDADGGGFAIRLGARSLVTDDLELYGNLSRYNMSLIDDSSFYGFELDPNVFEVGARYRLSERFLVTLGYANQGDLKTLSFGARFTFPSIQRMSASNKN